jgi:hypothetical protein
MDGAFLENCLYDASVADRFGSDLAVTNQAFGTGLHPIMAFDLDHRSQHSRGSLLDDLDECFR